MNSNYTSYIITNLSNCNYFFNIQTFVNDIPISGITWNILLKCKCEKHDFLPYSSVSLLLFENVFLINEKNLGFLTFLICSVVKLRFTTHLKP